MRATDAGVAAFLYRLLQRGGVERDSARHVRRAVKVLTLAYETSKSGLERAAEQQQLQLEEQAELAAKRERKLARKEAKRSRRAADAAALARDAGAAECEAPGEAME